VFHAYANEEVEIVDARDKQKTAVTGIEIFCKLLDSAEAGDKGSVLDA
jgi:translation elongation factor EF-Tu-like GTPase